MGAMCCSSKDKPDNENDLNESTNTISCASDNEESNEILEQYKNE